MRKNTAPPLAPDISTVQCVSYTAQCSIRSVHSVQFSLEYMNMHTRLWTCTSYAMNFTPCSCLGFYVAWRKLALPDSLTAHCTLHGAHCTVHIARCTLHSVHCSVHTARCTLHGAHFTVHTARCTLHSVHCRVHGAHCAVHTVRCTLHTAHWKLHTAHFILHTVHCTLHLKTSDMSNKQHAQTCLYYLQSMLII